VPITNLIESLGVGPIIDAEVKVGAVYTALLQLQDIKGKAKFLNAKGVGFNTFALSAKPDTVDLSIIQGCLDVTALRVLLGQAAIGTAGTTPSIVETQAFKATALCPYFELWVRSTDITGLGTLGVSDALPADMWTHFPKCKVMDVGNIIPSVKDYATVELTVEAIVDASDILWEYVTHETKMALPSA
jgi:hypothetical protein